MISDDLLAGRVALVTGASGGIGKATALRLAGEGAVIALGYSSSSEAAGKIAASIQAGGGRAVAIGADLRRSEAPGELIQTVEEELGPVDLLVSNAGLGRPGTLEDLTVHDFDETLAVNLRAPFLLAQRALPGMEERRFGRVLSCPRSRRSPGESSGRTMRPRKPGCMG